MWWLFCSLLVYFSGSQLSNLYNLLLRTCCVNFCIYFNCYFLCSFSFVFRPGVDQSLCASMRSPLTIRLGTLFSLAPRVAEFVSTTLLCTQEVCLCVNMCLVSCSSLFLCAFLYCDVRCLWFCRYVLFGYCFQSQLSYLTSKSLTHTNSTLPLNY